MKDNIPSEPIERGISIINNNVLHIQQEPSVISRLENIEPVHVEIPKSKYFEEIRDSVHEIIISKPNHGKSFFQLHQDLEMQQKYLDMFQKQQDLELIEKFYDVVGRDELTFKSYSSYGNSSHNKARELRFEAKQKKKRKKRKSK